MLDQETKKRIDDCRNILVGKVPDPKSQVEQITIAMIYKFMYDMDLGSIEMGGIPNYFVGEYEKYSWGNIFNPRIGGNEMISLYGEGIVKMNLNPNIPQLFRDIFKNAYLPYRDPETLKLFLKGINEFHYSHSEKLGDAFEYLLSVLGSQGDAGQFRTPRHIIDFIVELIQPKKNERCLDPACGTSGFLISSYKHILRNNTKKNLGDLITPDERNKLVENISGYDISPDMVRLSLVNLYLHNFSNPKIYEYDTLTSEERWNEYYDVILANPPFMSPKGGIKPHKRFSIQSNRAEVLFVDYIMEHLTPKGRSGIVVPEGIIFQSGIAYKSLRKSMVEKYLVGIISLPSGVFQPYSGVKTSILILDKELSQKTDKIFFGKVDNDGFDLGSQRREIEKNDLPILTKEVTEYLEGLRKGKVVESKKLTYVPKEQILGSTDIGLSYDRYVSKSIRTSSFPVVKLKEVVEVISGQSPESNFYNTNGIGLPFYQGRTDFGLLYLNKTENYTEKITKTSIYGDVVMSVRAPVGPVNLVPFEICIGRGLCALRSSEKIDRLYLFYFLKGNQDKIKGNSGAIFDNINKNQIEDLLIPVPPIEVQEEIVRELEQYQKIIDGAKQVVDNYKPVIEIDTSWEMILLEDLIKLSSGKGLVKRDMIEGEYEVFGGNGISGFHNSYFIEEKTIVIGRVGEYCGVVHITSPKCWITDNGLYITQFYKEIKLEYLSIILTSLNLNNYAKVGGQPSISQSTILELSIPYPPLEIQQSIVERIESERQIIEGNKKLIEIYTQKIQDRINKIWGE